MIIRFKKSSLAVKLAEQGWLPDALIRQGIRSLCKARLQLITDDDCELAQSRLIQCIEHIQLAEIAPLTEEAHAIHDQIPAAFYQYCLGMNRKYSSSFWLPDTRTLDEAEHLALAQICSLARLGGPLQILELGCGWGALTLWMASHYPNAQVTAVSSSSLQREHIMQQAKARGLSNIQVIMADINLFDTKQSFDRVVAVEMFEPMQHYPMLYAKVARWLKPDGLFFKHIFVHRNTPYALGINDADLNLNARDHWLNQHFFKGTIMPSDDLPLYFQDELKVINKWRWSGTHYQKTANAWLANMDKHHHDLTPLFQAIYGEADAEVWRQRWRIFFMVCAELFGYNHGQTWWGSHYLFCRR
ncbi:MULTISPECIES: cyclopropane-fatty-acyl-phospholipid synthase family protein [unclassified Methylophilus]|uniref:SAM-dependent methyltransferase n=1 Tax=unclassified Methylophilus TaxID=2630143 RepID=UPI0003757406|nr:MULTISPECIES: class I SAM-dependent methyltransferase [unclassified Methylophilus]